MEMATVDGGIRRRQPGNSRRRRPRLARRRRGPWPWPCCLASWSHLRSSLGPGRVHRHNISSGGPGDDHPQHSAMTSAPSHAAENPSLSGRRGAGAAARATAASVRCYAAARSYSITLLPGDGIGPEVVAVARTSSPPPVSKEGKRSPELSSVSPDGTSRVTTMMVACLFSLRRRRGAPVQGDADGGAALDAAGVPLPDETLAAARASDAILRRD
ncbi:hypothetical protein ZWY2020_011661 [Hordeum vulgare]|nr:hypothetical protein ZWY2020_011661 [Hordeum vulgare]